MAFFRVGMRVKKVRGPTDTGLIGIVTGHRACSEGFTLIVNPTTSWTNTLGWPMRANSECYTLPELWEPIIDKHEPCESEFKQSLDRLLEKVGERV